MQDSHLFFQSNIQDKERIPEKAYDDDITTFTTVKAPDYDITTFPQSEDKVWWMMITDEIESFVNVQGLRLFFPKGRKHDKRSAAKCAYNV